MIMRWKNCSNNVGLLPAKSVTLIINNLNYLIMKSLHTFSALCALLVMFAVQQTYAQTTNDVLTSNNVVSVNDYFSSTDEVENFINFVVEVQEAGDYYAQFWLLPAKYTNGDYTQFKVYVNNDFAGKIKTTKGNWQSALMENVPELNLKAGKNLISVSTNAPEFPQVETVRLSKKAQATKISSADYDAYLDKAIHSDGTPEQNFSVSPMSVNDVGSYVKVENVPLRYSFYKTFTFEKGQEIYITSSSDKPHAIDLFLNGVTVNISSNTSDKEALFDSNYELGPVLSDVQLLRKPSPEEGQSINWVAFSEKAVNNPNIYITTLKATIPMSGSYMVKLRSADDRVLGSADLNVNGLYFYEKAPMYYARIKCKMPADGNSYIALARSTVKDKANPVLFVETSVGQRVVGFNDDNFLVYSSALLYNLGNRDSYISQIYQYPTEYLHVSSSKSLITLNSSCTVEGAISQNSEIYNVQQTRAKSESISNLSIKDDCGNVNISSSTLDLSSQISISSNEKINEVHVYTLSGVSIANLDVNSYSAEIPLQEVGITKQGMYIISIETENRSVSQKILVR